MKKKITKLWRKPLKQDEGATPSELQCVVGNVCHFTVEQWVEEQVKDVVLGGYLGIERLIP